MAAEELKAEQLAHEEHIRSLLEIRNRGRHTHWWEQPGLTAIAGTVAGAVFTFVGGYVLKSQEIGAQQRAAELQQTRTEILEANNALAGMLKANEMRFLLARGEMADLPHAEREKMRLETNDLQKAWRHQRENAEMAVRLSFAATPMVSAAWSKARARLEDYTACMEEAYEAYQRANAPENVCQQAREMSLGAMEEFRSALVAAYRKAQEAIQ